MELNLTTIKGASLRVHANEVGKCAVDVNGKPHTSHSPCVTVCRDEKNGPHITLAGHVKAQLSESDFAKATAFFAAAKIAGKAYIAEENSRYVRENPTEYRMRDMHSRYSVN